MGVDSPFVLFVCSFFNFITEGRKHDAGMLADSGLLNDLQRFAFSTTGHAMCLYGDPAYPLRIHLQAPFRNAVLTPAMEAFNSSMSAVGESVEWLFGDIVNYFKFMDFRKSLKIGLSSVGKMYIVSALLRNAHTCFNGNRTSEYFNLEPPTLEEYFVQDSNWCPLCLLISTIFFY